MKPYPSYKDSGVEWIGKIPNNWSMNKIKYLFSSDKKQISVKEFEHNQVIHYSIPNVQIYGKGKLENGEDIESSKLLLHGKELLISRLNPRKRTICISEPDTEHMILGSGEFIVLVPSGMNLEYCYYQFLTDGMTQNLDSLVESVTKSHQRVRPERLFNTFYIEPPKDEIEQIISFLDHKTQKIDELIKKTEKKIELLKEKRTALINHCVTKGLNPDVEMKDSCVMWIGEIPSDWEARKVKYLFSIIKRISGEKGYDVLSVTQKGIKIKDIITGKGQLSMDYTKYQIVDIGDYVMNHMDLLTGFVDISKYHGVTSPDYRCFKLIDNQCISKYYLFLFQMGYTNKIFYCFGQGSSKFGRWRLPSDQFKNFKFPYPSITEQQQIVSYLDEQTQKIDSIIEIEIKRIDLLKEYRQSLISNVVTGKIDVRDEVAI